MTDQRGGLKRTGAIMADVYLHSILIQDVQHKTRRFGNFPGYHADYPPDALPLVFDCTALQRIRGRWLSRNVMSLWVACQTYPDQPTIQSNSTSLIQLTAELAS